MKIVMRIFFALGALIVLALIAALFVGKDYAIERAIVIDKPRQEVFDYIKYVKNQDEFSKWNQMDPRMKKTYQGTDGTPGFVAAWESSKDGVGRGEQEIKAVVDGERLETELRFLEPFASTSAAYLATEALSEAQTRVTWGFSGKAPYPFNLMKLFMDMDARIGADLEVGLSNLKTKLETAP